MRQDDEHHAGSEYLVTAGKSRGDEVSGTPWHLFLFRLCHDLGRRLGSQRPRCYACVSRRLPVPGARRNQDVLIGTSAMAIALIRNSGLSTAHQRKAVTILAPANTSMTSAAPRVSQVIGMTFSRLLPPMMAPPAATHSASTAPIPTASGSPYLTARLTVRIWVRSPNSAAKTTAKAIAATGRNRLERPCSATSSLESWRCWRHSNTAPNRNKTPATAWIGRCGSNPSRLPAVTASTTCAVNATAAPANTKAGRYRLPMTRHARTVLSGSSAGSTIRKEVPAAARFTREPIRSGQPAAQGTSGTAACHCGRRSHSDQHWSPGTGPGFPGRDCRPPGDGATPLRGFPC